MIILDSFATFTLLLGFDDVPNAPRLFWVGLDSGLLATIRASSSRTSVYVLKLIEWSKVGTFLGPNLQGRSPPLGDFPAIRTKRVTSPCFPPPPEPISQSFAADLFRRRSCSSD